MTETMTLRWLTPGTSPLQVCGLAWFAREGRLRRLPSQPVEPLPEMVDMLANHPGGATPLSHQRDLPAGACAPGAGGGYAPYDPLGQCGVDYYVDGEFAGCASFGEAQGEYTSGLPVGIDGREHEVLLNLPLYRRSSCAKSA